MKRLRRLGILSAVLIALLSMSATGNVVQQFYVSEPAGPRGVLAVTAYHPVRVDGCATPAQRAVALADALTQHAAAQRLLASVTPRPAYAAREAGCVVTALRGPLANLIVRVG